ncbi:MAG: hypothetical protein HQ567_20850 [Candidatus Nealsonbacteria bacterium]|nr:hypothetical protein [Candidatus Nealsonbacteria bacterium]
MGKVRLGATIVHEIYWEEPYWEEPYWEEPYWEEPYEPVDATGGSRLTPRWNPDCVA